MRAEGLVLSVRLSPKSSRDEIAGVEELADGRTVLKVRVRAVPQDGEANAALQRVLAKALHISASAVRIESGASSRLKTLHLEGDAKTLAAGLARLLTHGEAY
ncbi:MAG TPA: DUF167 family protein [Methylocella sp.]|nr:DUF167 family protein [Methylocella sp.]